VTLRRTAGIGMLALEAALLWRTMGYLPVAVLTILVALAGCWPRLQVEWKRPRRLMAVAAAAAVYAAWWWMDLQHLSPSRSAQFENSLSLAAALCLMMMQAMLYYRRHPAGLPGQYPFLGALAMTFAADCYVTVPEEGTIAFGLTMAFGFLVAVFYGAGGVRAGAPPAPHRWYKFALLALCCLLCLLLAGGTAWVLSRSDRAIGRWLAQRNFVPSQLVLGNQQSARLNSMTDIKSHNVDHIALHIVADDSPGYLRGQVYATYTNDTWGALAPGGSPDPVAVPPPGYTPRSRSEILYPLRADAVDFNAALAVYPDAAIERALFTPLETGWVGLPGDVLVNGANLAQAAHSLGGQVYQVLTAGPAPPAPLSPEERERYTGLPPVLAPQLMALAARVTGGRDTTLAKAHAITQYFIANYDYALGIQVPRGADPMEYFLFSEPPPAAHCEFFATGAALLLRAAGVPARYVTGVGVWERHRFADYWVARNRDAHAWVEAWDEERGWFIVEATPASGLPQAMEGQSTNALRDFWSMVTLQVKHLVAALRGGAWPAAASLLRGLALGVAAFLGAYWWAFALLAAAGVLLWRARRWRRRRPASPSKNDIKQRNLERQLSRMDRWVRKRLRQTRPAQTTLHAFARSLEANRPEDESARQTAQWYRRWAAARYRAHLDEDAIRALDTELFTVQRDRGREERRRPMQ